MPDHLTVILRWHFVAGFAPCPVYPTRHSPEPRKFWTTPKDANSANSFRGYLIYLMRYKTPVCQTYERSTESCFDVLAFCFLGVQQKPVSQKAALRHETLRA